MPQMVPVLNHNDMIYVLIAIKVPKWFIKAIDKNKMGFCLEGQAAGE
jgi:hypothetical protein